MNGIYQNYQIDLSSNNNFVQYNTVQGDGNDIRQIEVELIEHNKPYILGNDVEVFIAGTKPDTKQIFNSCEVTEQGTILIDVTTQMSAVTGRGDYQIVLISKTTNQQLKSFPFILFVKEAAFDAETITSSDEFQALSGMVNKIESTFNKTDLVDSMLESSAQILEDTTAAYDNAVKSLEKAQNAIDTAESINSTAQESADNAKQSEENSALHSDIAKSYAVGTNNEIRDNDALDNAKYYKEQAESSFASALQSANLAGQKADDASASEANAMQYAANASASETNANDSADNAKTSAENAAQSSADALQSAANSENSAVKSAQSAMQALESATNAGTAEASAKNYAKSAADSAMKAEETSKISIATPEKSGIVKPDGTTITIDEDGTLHGTVAGLTVEDLSNAPQPAINGIADIALTGTDTGQDPPALKSVPLSALSKGVADEIDSEALLQNYTLKTAFIQDQTRQDETISLNSENIGKLTAKISAVEENGVTSADLSNYLPLTGGSISNDSKSVNITPQEINGDGTQELKNFKSISQINSINNINYLWSDEINFGTSISGSGSISTDYFYGTEFYKNNKPLNNAEQDYLVEIPLSDSNKNTNYFIIGTENSLQNYYYLKFTNGMLIIAAHLIRPTMSSYVCYFPISFIDDNYIVTATLSQSGSKDSSTNICYSSKTNNFVSFTLNGQAGSDYPIEEGNIYRESMWGADVICIGRWK